MKKLKLISSFFICMCLCSACGGKSQNSHSELTTEPNTNQVVTTEERTNNEIAIVEVDENSESNYIDWQNLKFYLPNWLSREDYYGYDVYSGKQNTDDTIYYHYMADGFYDSSREGYIDGFTCENVPEIIRFSLDEVVNKYYPYFKDTYTVSVEKEETVECNGYPFIKHSGVIHAEKHAEKGEIADLNYVAYYGCMDMKMFDGRSVPMMWVAFSNVTDDRTIDDMESLVDTAANDAEWIEE